MLRIKKDPQFYQQLKNTTKPNPPPGPFACWNFRKEGYGRYRPNRCYLDVLRCSIQIPGRKAVQIDPKPIQAQLRRLDNYVGSRNWAPHNQRVRALRTRNRC
jgi:hypothetical protein